MRETQTDKKTSILNKRLVISVQKRPAVTKLNTKHLHSFYLITLKSARYIYGTRLVRVI